MVRDNINSIIRNAINSNKNNNIKNELELITNLHKAIKDNYSLFESANKIDLSNNNGFQLEYEVMDKILTRYTNTKPIINQNKENYIYDNNLLKSLVYSKLGIVLVVFDGNPYVMLEMILLGILTHNTIIFSYDGFMHGTNGLLINLVQTILDKEKYVKEMFQHSFSINSEEYFDNFKTINKTIIIGDNDMQNKYLKLCSTNVIVSGYNNYDIYIDDLSHFDVVKKIMNQKLNVTFYINSDLKINIDNGIYVDDIDEVITQINYNGSGYSCAIFTQTKENASKFIRNINSKNVMVNASPTLEQQLDIKQEDLLKIKNIIMPNIYQ